MTRWLKVEHSLFFLTQLIVYCIVYCVLVIKPGCPLDLPISKPLFKLDAQVQIIIIFLIVSCCEFSLPTHPLSPFRNNHLRQWEKRESGGFGGGDLTLNIYIQVYLKKANNLIQKVNFNIHYTLQDILSLFCFNLYDYGLHLMKINQYQKTEYHEIAGTTILHGLVYPATRLYNMQVHNTAKK